MSELHASVSPGRVIARRGLLRTGLAGGVAAVAALAPARAGWQPTLAQEATPTSDTLPAETAGTNPYFGNESDVLNFPLAFELLESALYRQGLEQFDTQAFVTVGYDASVRDYLERISENEETHVAFLTETIASLGGEPVGVAEYTFPYGTLGEWLVLVQQVEEVGLDAYTGAARYLIDADDLLTAALTIHGVEGRHLAYLRLLNGIVPFPNAVEAPLTPTEVAALASQYVVGGVPEPTAG